MIARSVDNAEQKLKATMENLVVQFKDVPDSMLEEKSNAERLAETAKDLVLQGYQVQKICCGECDQDDVLVIIHTCNPHRFTHTCKSKREEQELAEVKKKVKKKLGLDDDDLDLTTDLI
jgi:hypothetical protein